MDTTTAPPLTTAEAGRRASEPRPPEHPRALEGRSLASLFSDLWRETTTLVHEEAELAKADVAARVAQAARAVSAMAIGAAVLFAGFVVLLLAAVNGLSPYLPPDDAAWMAPLIVGGVVVVVGLIAVATGRRRMTVDQLKPERTLRSLRRDRELAESHLKEHRS